MRKISGVFLTILMASCLTFGVDALYSGDITAESAVLIDARTGQVLFDKNMHARRHPASITKIMTGLLTMENCLPAEMVTVSEEAVRIPYNSSHIALSPGEVLPVDSAMYALMLPSANDAANALAEHVAGSQSAFAAMMTNRARELGALNTSFANPHGLPDDRHLTTAYDMAIITAEAIQNPGFLHYFGTGRHTIPSTNLQSEERPFTNQQFMLLPDQWVYNPDVIGGKVGYTQEARHTMSTAAAADGRILIAVVMGCGIDEKFYDTQKLFDYGFDSFTKVIVPSDKLSGLTAPVMEDGETVGEAVFAAPTTEELSMLVPDGMDVGSILYKYNLPESVEKGGETAGSVTLTVSGKPDLIMEVPLTARVRYYTQEDSVQAMSAADLSTGGARSKWVYLLAIIPLVLLLWLAVRIWRIRQRAKRRLQRRRRIMDERRRRYGR